MKMKFEFWWKSLLLGLLLILGYKLMDNYVALFDFLNNLISIVTKFIIGGIFGVIGMFIGVPIIAALRIIVNDYLDDKKIDGTMCN